MGGVAEGEGTSDGFREGQAKTTCGLLGTGSAAVVPPRGEIVPAESATIHAGHLH